MNFVRICIYVVVAAAVVYFGLEHFLPHHKAELAVETGPSAEAVPAGSSEQTAGTAANQDKPLSEADARKIAEDVGRKVGEEVAQRALEKQTAQPAASEEAANSSSPTAEKPAAAPSTEPQAESAAPSNVASAEPSVPAKRKTRAKAAPGPQPESLPKAEAEPKPQPAPEAETAAAPAPKAPRTRKSSAPPPSTPPLAAVAPWWPPANQQVAGKLNLMFAGEAASDHAIALLFSSTFSNAAAAGSHIKVTDAAGKPVEGQWALAPNPRLLVFRVTSGGRYNVALAADLADAQGKTLTGALKGSVDVH